MSVTEPLTLSTTSCHSNNKLDRLLLACRRWVELPLEDSDGEREFLLRDWEN